MTLKTDTMDLDKIDKKVSMQSQDHKIKTEFIEKFVQEYKYKRINLLISIIEHYKKRHAARLEESTELRYTLRYKNVVIEVIDKQSIMTKDIRKLSFKAAIRFPQVGKVFTILCNAKENFDIDKMNTDEMTAFLQREKEPEYWYSCPELDAQRDEKYITEDVDELLTQLG